MTNPEEFYKGENTGTRRGYICEYCGRWIWAGEAHKCYRGRVLVDLVLDELREEIRELKERMDSIDYLLEKLEEI